MFSGIGEIHCGMEECFVRLLDKFGCSFNGLVHDNVSSRGLMMSRHIWCAVLALGASFWVLIRCDCCSVQFLLGLPCLN
jgi:hypothetical protein